VLYSSNISEELRISAKRRRNLYTAIALHAIPDEGIDLRRRASTRIRNPHYNRTCADVLQLPTFNGLQAHEMWVLSRTLFPQSRCHTPNELMLKEHERWICGHHTRIATQGIARWRYIALSACAVFSTPKCRITVNDILGPRRLESISLVRHVVMYLIRYDCHSQGKQLSLPTIGRIFRNRDHTTVLHGVRKIECMLATDHSLRARIEHVRSLYT